MCRSRELVLRNFADDEPRRTIGRKRNTQLIEPTATPPYPAAETTTEPDDPRVVAARNALTAATADHDRISSLLAAAIEAIASVHAASDKASGNLASDAIRDLKPTDLDEVRAACRGGEGPPTIVQIVVCCCCSLLELANKKPPESTKSSSTPLGPLPPLSPRGGRPPTTPKARQGRVLHERRDERQGEIQN